MFPKARNMLNAPTIARIHSQAQFENVVEVKDAGCVRVYYSVRSCCQQQ